LCPNFEVPMLSTRSAELVRDTEGGTVALHGQW